eukprot:scaffold183984_cov33-Tisochrysis_lutea.AAC.2
MFASPNDATVATTGGSDHSRRTHDPYPKRDIQGRAAPPRFAQRASTQQAMTDLRTQAGRETLATLPARAAERHLIANCAVTYLSTLEV